MAVRNVAVEGGKWVSATALPRQAVPENDRLYQFYIQFKLRRKLPPVPCGEFGIHP